VETAELAGSGRLAAHKDAVYGAQNGFTSLPCLLVSPQGNEVVALESSYTPDPNTGCSQSGSLDHATRLRDKMPWIESVIGPCGTSTDAGGHSIKRCYSLACDGAPDYETGAWDGCRGSGCSVCSDVIDAYPHYFEHHRNCSRNTTCGGYHYRCSSNCPAPTDADR